MSTSGNETESILELYRRKGKESLFFLARGILGFKDLDPNIHGPLCKSLENYKDFTRLMVTFPRTWFKSTICSIAYPIWRAINDPNVRILVVQNSYSNATKKLGAIKNIFEQNKLFRALYPEVLPPTGNTWRNECLVVNRTASHPEGTFEAAGVGTATTSRHYDEIIEDDTIAPKKDDMTGIVQQPTQADIEKAIGWHRQCHPLLIHPLKSRIIVVGTRWAERDLQGWIMENSSNYIHLSRSLYEDDLGNPVRPESGGHIVWNRFDKSVARELEKAEGPYMFACLYMNLPTAAINQVFKRDWIRYYDNIDKHADTYYVTSVDLASAKKEETSDPDYVVVLTSAVVPKEHKIYVVHYTRGRLDPGETVNAILDHIRVYKPMEVLVESIGYQRTINYWLRKRMNQANIVAYIHELTSLQGSKVERIRGLQPYFADERVVIKPSMNELEQELLAFPKGSHDDLADALSMQIEFWYNTIESFQDEERRELVSDPFSGAAIIEELQGRTKKLRSYPYDVGQLAERYQGYREYSYN